MPFCFHIAPKIIGGGLALLALMSCGEHEKKQHLAGGDIPLVTIDPTGFTAVIGDVKIAIPSAEHAFSYAAHEVTQAEFEKVLRHQTAIVEGAELPVDRVLHSEAIAFCEELTRLDRAAGTLPEDKIYRVPNQREWLIAAFSKSKEQERIEEGAWHLINSAGHLQAVGSMQANANGPHDLFGNVAEWVEPDATAALVLADMLQNRLGQLETQLQQENALMREARDKMMKSLMEDFPIDDGLRFATQSKWIQPEIENDEYQSHIEAIRETIEMLDVATTEDLASTATLVGGRPIEAWGSPNIYEKATRQLKHLRDQGLGDAHPDVKALVGEVEELEEQLREAAQSTRSTLLVKLHQAEKDLENSEARKQQADAEREAELLLANAYRETRDAYQELRARVSRTEELIERATFDSPGSASARALGGNLFDHPDDLLLPAPVSAEGERKDGVGFRFVMVDE